MSRKSAYKEIVSGKRIVLKGMNFKYGIYRLQWKFAPLMRFVTKFPTHIDLELTNTCNLKCVMCPHGSDTSQQFRDSLGFMDFGLFCRVIDEGSQKGLYSIKLNWRGEPLMNRRFVVDAIKYAKEKGVVDVLMNTNGLLLDESLSKSLIDAGLDGIIFSIDGTNKKTYESIRTGGDFDRAVKNAKDFISIRDCLNRKKPFVRIQMVKMDNNLNEVKEFKKMWQGLADSISFQDYTSRGEPVNRLMDSQRFVGRLACPQIWQRIVVTWDGNVVMCCRDWNAVDVLGQLDYEGGKDIEYFWHGDRLREIRKFHKKRMLDNIKACGECSFKESFNWK